MSKLSGCACGIDDGYDNNHRRASGEVARLLPVIAAHRTPMAAPRLHLDYAWPDLADKASEPSRATSYPLSYLSWQGLAKSAAGSEQMASWFTVWVCHADVMQALAGCSALPRKACGEGTISNFGIDNHQSTVPGSHRALPGTHGGGHSGRRTAPTAWTVPTSAFRVGKGVKHQLQRQHSTGPPGPAALRTLRKNTPRTGIHS